MASTALPPFSFLSRRPSYGSCSALICESRTLWERRKVPIYIRCLFAIISVVARLCQVSFVDLAGMRHAVEISAPITEWLRQPGLQSVRGI